MRVAEGWTLFVVGTLIYAFSCAALGPWFLRVSPVPLVVFIGYPYLKRFTPMCHFGVGLALALAPLAGYAAAHPDRAHPATALWLAGFAFTWVAGFDIIYATLDEDFDRLHRISSMVAWLGRPRALRLSAALHAVAFLCLLTAAWTLMGPMETLPAWAVPAVVGTLTLSGVLLWLEQRWAEDVDLAFFKVNVLVGFSVLAMVLTARTATGW
jgi:4-hydroxybenzoate polyprenyltransferase